MNGFWINLDGDEEGPFACIEDVENWLLKHGFTQSKHDEDLWNRASDDASAEIVHPMSKADWAEYSAEQRAESLIERMK